MIDISAEKFYFDCIKERIQELSVRNFYKSESTDFISKDSFIPVIGVELTEIVTKRKYRDNSKIKFLVQGIYAGACAGISLWNCI